jgi:NADPH-dependent 2,4-dienoyl-CoA reductase/sulfur reductase-like enzyme
VTGGVVESVVVVGGGAAGLTAVETLRDFWSDQGDLRIQVTGEFPAAGTVALVDGDTFIAVCNVDARIVGAVGWNRPRQFTRWRSRVGEVLEPVVTL